MKILIDTREQSPLPFDYEYITKTISVKLDVGDVMCVFEDGYIPRISFERKSLGDLFGTMGKGHDRFKRELERASALQIRLMLIVEAPFGKVLKGYERSSITGSTMVRKLMTMWLKYNLYPIFCRDREEASRYIYEFFCAIGRLKSTNCQRDRITNGKLQDISGRGNIQVIR